MLGRFFQAIFFLVVTTNIAFGQVNLPAAIEVKIVDANNEVTGIELIDSPQQIRRGLNIWNSKPQRPSTKEERDKLNQSNPDGPWVKLTSVYPSKNKNVPRVTIEKLLTSDKVDRMAMFLKDYRKSLQAKLPNSIDVRIVDSDNEARTYTVASPSHMRQCLDVWNTKSSMTKSEKDKVQLANPSGPWVELTEKRNAGTAEIVVMKDVSSAKTDLMKAFIQKAKRSGHALPTYTNSVGMKLVKIPPGSFQMGSKASHGEVQRIFDEGGDPNRFSDEHPRHSVNIFLNFYAGAHEVTVDQFQQFVDATGYRTSAERNGGAVNAFNPTEGVASDKVDLNWKNGEPNEPVAYVSWEDANSFALWLKKKENRNYRLPTEAEWEYFARARTTSYFNTGNSPQSLADFANVPDYAYVLSRDEPINYDVLRVFDGFSGKAPVGSFKPNSFGLFDTHGNVFEWCFDGYTPNAYAIHASVNPYVKHEGVDLRVIRGGCYM
jgi:formylglycine-generating enzyme required for sulfatase activity